MDVVAMKVTFFEDTSSDEFGGVKRIIEFEPPIL